MSTSSSCSLLSNDSVGRTDDLIILASGEKIIPAPTENIIASSALVQGVLMFGRGRNQVGFLIEPRSEHAIDVQDENAMTEFRNKIWYVWFTSVWAYSPTEVNQGLGSKRRTGYR